MLYDSIQNRGINNSHLGQLRSIGESILQWAPIAIIIGFWELMSGWIVSETILPPPIDVFAVSVEFIVSGDILYSFGLSLWRVILGLSLSICVGIAIGIGMARSKPIENTLDIFLALLYPTPKIALLPLLLLIVGTGTGTVVLVIFLTCLLPMVLNSYNAAGSVDQSLIWSAQMMGTSDQNLLRKVVLPSTIPQIMTGIRQAIPFAFLSLIAVEMVAANEGIGAEIIGYSNIGQYTPMLALVVIITIAAYTAATSFERFRARVIVWQ